MEFAVARRPLHRDRDGVDQRGRGQLIEAALYCVAKVPAATLQLFFDALLIGDRGEARGGTCLVQKRHDLFALHALMGFGKLEDPLRDVRGGDR